MKYLFALITSLALFSCSQVGNFLDKNPLLVDIAVREAMVRYIDRGDSVEEKRMRAINAGKVLGDVKQLVSSGQETTVSGLISFANESIDWKNMPAHDRLLVQDIFLIIQSKLNSESDLISPDTVIKINSIIMTATSVTKLF